MNRFTAQGALAFALVGTAVQGQDLSSVEARLKAECVSEQFSGSVLVVSGPRELLSLRCGSADPAAGRPIEAETRFRIFSITKFITALAVMSLAERGQMDLDASVTRYISDAPQGWEPVTVRHLHNHTSGLPDATNSLVKAFDSDHRQAMRRVLSDLALSAPGPNTRPGEAWAYNNFGHELLAEAVAEAGGAPFATVLQDRVFGPAGMSSALVEQPELSGARVIPAEDSRLARGWNGAPGALREAKPLSFVQLGAGSVHTTAADLIALGKAFQEGRLVSDETRSEMTKVLWRRGQRDPTRGYGLGVMVRGEDGLEFVGHDGGVNGYISDLEIYPESGAILVVLSNLGFAETDWIKTRWAMPWQVRSTELGGDQSREQATGGHALMSKGLSSIDSRHIAGDQDFGWTAGTSSIRRRADVSS